jgi:predicted lipoprotein with Yx(FWY)xxD motif
MPKTLSFLLPAAVAAAALSTALACAAAEPAHATDGVLVTATGMTLYTFDKDADGKSACNGPCATNWPPLAAGADAKAEGAWSLVARDDGARQWAYKGKPLYTFQKDAKPGDRAGDNFKDVWHVARP